MVFSLILLVGVGNVSVEVFDSCGLIINQYNHTIYSNIFDSFYSIKFPNRNYPYFIYIIDVHQKVLIKGLGHSYIFGISV